MKFALAALASLLVTSSASLAADSFHLKDGDRVVFYGDSITDQRLYTVLTETYVVTRYPNLNISWVHSGWGGDRVNGGGGGPIDTRLQRDVFPYHPTVFTVMLGMNDGSYSAETEASDRTYFDGMRHIIDSVKAADPGVRITLIEPSAYDDVTRPPTFPGGYNEVLLSFSKWLANYADANGLETSDFNRPLTAMLRRADAQSHEEAQKILPDRVHPSFAGHLVMAEQLLKTWGARPIVASVTIQSGTPSVKASEYAHVLDLRKTGDTLAWTETDDGLPLPFSQWIPSWSAGPLPLVLKSSDVTEALNEEPLTVLGLHRGVYSLKIDGKTVGTFNDDQFTHGINLALLKTPMTDQAKEVYDLTVAHCDIHNERWRTVQVPLASYNLPQTAPDLAAADALETAVLQKRQQVAQPVAHHFEIVPVQ